MLVDYSRDTAKSILAAEKSQTKSAVSADQRGECKKIPEGAGENDIV